ncbi:MAG TPA: hypothetical protein VNA04_03590 [Thermoanaerobaculia bacterium]|nr:hypothetical protein [Thermoanaerobaculia bacterium]
MIATKRAPILAIVSLACPLAAAMNAVWVFRSRHDWPTGESGLFSLVVMAALITAILAAGAIIALISLLRKEPRRLAVAALIINAVLLVGGWVAVVAALRSHA